MPAANKKFSATDIKRFYDYLWEELAPISVGESRIGEKHDKNDVDTIYNVYEIFKQDKKAQKSFPKGIESILTPAHLDVLNNLLKVFAWDVNSRLAFTMLDHLTIDAGTAEFVKDIDTFAELMHHEGRHGDNSDRTIVFRYIEEIKKPKVADDNNQVYFDYDAIYKTSGLSHLISAFDLELMVALVRGITKEKIQHFIKPSFDETILPEIVRMHKNEWRMQDFKPKESVDFTHISDENIKLQRHLRKRIANQTHADMIAKELFGQVLSRETDNDDDRLALMDLALAQADAGKYDNVTFVERLTLPQPAIQQVNVLSKPVLAEPQKTSSNHFSIFHLIPAAFVAFICVLSAKSMYRCAVTLFAKKHVVRNTDKVSQAELSLLVAGSDNESDEDKKEHKTMRRRVRICGR